MDKKPGSELPTPDADRARLIAELRAELKVLNTDAQFMRAEGGAEVDDFRDNAADWVEKRGRVLADLLVDSTDPHPPDAADRRAAIRCYFNEGRCSGHHQFNGRYCRDAAPPDRWCIHCAGFVVLQQADADAATIAQLRHENFVLRESIPHERPEVTEIIEAWLKQALAALDR